MANPNIVNTTEIQGKTQTFALDVSETTLLTASANSVYKINVIQVANIDGVSAADVTIKYDDGVNNRAIVSTLSVPADAAVVVTDKNTGFYLEENDSIKASAGASADLTCMISYERIV